MAHIVLVEPDAVLGKAMTKYLKEQSHKVSWAQDAQDAVSYADIEKPDMVVLELAMPKNNGIAFLNEFRSYPDWKNVPVIIYTKIPFEDSGLSDINWKLLGISHYLYKPTQQLSVLAKRVLENLDHHAASKR